MVKLTKYENLQTYDLFIKSNVWAILSEQLLVSCLSYYDDEILLCLNSLGGVRRICFAGTIWRLWDI